MSVSAADIAVVGLGCRLPGGVRSLDGLGALLEEGRDAVTEIGEDRFSKTLYYHPDPAVPGKSYCFAAGVVEGLTDFDHGFFGMTPRKTIQTDPQHRLLLQTSWEAFDSAGIDPWKLEDRNVDVFVGISANDYADRFQFEPERMGGHFMIGNTPSTAANRLSYVYNFTGESMVVDTACSSSLVALHRACEALAHGNCSMAVAAGAHALLTPFPFIGFSKARMLSPAGRCKAFSASADGFVRAEGVVTLLLAPLSMAQEKDWPVLGVIRGTGVNTDGRKNAMWEPNPAAQQALIEDVMRAANVEADDFLYFEAHGTGTAVGDPREALAIGRAVGQRRTKGALPLGSLKSNIGHLEPVSGLAALAKVLAVFRRGALFPTLHASDPNPAIDFAGLGLVLQTDLSGLSGEGVIGVNSFGYGGVNAHVILAPPPVPAPSSVPDGRTFAPLILSARSRKSLQAMAADYARMLEGGIGAQVLASAAAWQRPQLEHRALVWPAENKDEDYIRLLTDYAAGAAEPDFVTEERTLTAAGQEPGACAFVYSGNGSQWRGMAHVLLEKEPAFRAHLAAADAALLPHLGWSVMEALADQAGPDIERAEIAQPLLFAIQVALTHMMEEANIRPSAVLGHSVGEIAAAYAAGLITLAEGCAVVTARAHAQAPMRGKGGMATAGYSEQEFAAHILPCCERLEIAALNAPGVIAVSGPEDALEKLRDIALAEGRFFKKMDIAYPYHSSLMDGEVRRDFEARLKRAPRSAVTGVLGGQRPVFISTVTGAPWTGSIDTGYWWRNVREPVRFEEALSAVFVLAGDQIPPIFFEIGPHAVLTSYIRKIAAAQGHKTNAIALQLRNRDQVLALRQALARAYGLGLMRDPGAFVPRPAVRLDLPPYPWSNDAYPFAPNQDSLYKKDAHPFLDTRIAAGPDTIHGWETTIDPVRFPYLNGHRLDGAPVFPASGFIEMLCAAALAAPKEGDAELNSVIVLRNVNILSPLRFLKDSGVHVLTEITDGRGGLRIRSVSGGQAQLHAEGDAVLSGTPPFGQQITVPEEAPLRVLTSRELYGMTALGGLSYEGAFQVADHIACYADGTVTASIRPPEALSGDGYILHPAILDGALQLLFTQIQDKAVLLRADGFYLPASFENGWVLADGGRPAELRLRARSFHPLSLTADAAVLDDAGNVIASFENIRFRFLRHASREANAPLILRETLVPAGAVVGHARAGGVKRADTVKADDDLPLLLNALALSIFADVKQKFVPPLVAAGDDSLLTCMETALSREGLILPDGSLNPNHGLPAPDEVRAHLIAHYPEEVAWAGLFAGAEEKILHALNPAAHPGEGENTDLCLSFLRHILRTGPAIANAIAILREKIKTIAAALGPEECLRIAEETDGLFGALRYIAPLLPAGRTRYTLYVPEGELSVARAVEIEGVEIDVRILRAEARPDPGLYDVLIDSRLRAAEGAGDIIIRPAAQPEFIMALWLARRPMDSRMLAPPSQGWGLIAEESGAVSSLPSGGLAGRPVIWKGELTGLSRSLIRALEEQGAVVSLSEMGKALPEGALVVFAPSLQSAAVSETERNTMLCDFARLVVENGRLPAPSHLCVLTVNALNGLEGALGRAIRPSQAALWGMQRTAANESPSAVLRAFDFSLSASYTSEDYAALARHFVQCLARNLAEMDGPKDREWQIAPHGVRVPRVVADSDVSSGGGSVGDMITMLEQTRSGHIDGLRWHSCAGRAPKPGEVEVEVRTASLNFRDVMWAMGMLDPEALESGYAGATLGMECAGIVRSVGEGVSRFRPGDAVFAYGGQALASRMTVSEISVCALPAGLDFAAAATIPATFLTAWYALHHAARIRRGEKILIHGAAGGVGLAAIQIARQAGAEIFVTAGSPEKRAYLRAMGLTYIYDSRDSIFADEILRDTNGKGIDIVLNSLSGEAMHRNFDVLRPFGRYLELGKRDFYADTLIGVKPFRNNISYFGIDMDQLMAERPEMGAQLFAAVAEGFASRSLSPLPYQSISAGRIHQAFRALWRSHHIGKIIIDMEDLPVPAAASAINTRPLARSVHGRGAYLVTGGHGGFGLATAEWLVANGARHLILVSRSGPRDDDARQRIWALEQKGVMVVSALCDINDATKVEALLQGIPSLAGIVHAAALLEDRMMDRLDLASLRRVMAPKADAAALLDRLTRGRRLDLFVLYSSVTTLIGNIGQANYVAANRMLEAVALARRQAGEQALCVAWGPIGDTGLLARDENAAARELISRKFGSGGFLSSSEALETLGRLLESGKACAVVSRMNWRELAASLPHVRGRAFRDFLPHGDAGPASDGSFRLLLEDKTLAQREQIILDFLKVEIGAILMTAAADLPAGKPFAEMGIDSLLTVEIHMMIEEKTGLPLPPERLSSSMTLGDLARTLAETSCEGASGEASDDMVERAHQETLAVRHGGLTAEQRSRLGLDDELNLRAAQGGA